MPKFLLQTSPSSRTIPLIPKQDTRCSIAHIVSSNICISNEDVCRHRQTESSSIPHPGTVVKLARKAPESYIEHTMLIKPFPKNFSRPPSTTQPLTERIKIDGWESGEELQKLVPHITIHSRGAHSPQNLCVFFFRAKQRVWKKFLASNPKMNSIKNPRLLHMSNEAGDGDPHTFIR